MVRRPLAETEVKALPGYAGRYVANRLDYV